MGSSNSTSSHEFSSDRAVLHEFPSDRAVQGSPCEHSQSNRYEKKEVLNESLYGSVYLGLDTWTNQEVVIKSSDRMLALARTLPDGSSSQEDIKEEIRVHEMLSNDPEPCPFIIKLLAVVENEDTIDLVLERAEGGDLFAYYEEKTKKLGGELARSRGTPRYRELLQKHWDEVLKVMQQILRATAYLHSRNICHRDLSLENIMLDSNGDVKVIDFGNVREYTETNWLSERGQIGKVGYLSPECYANDNYDGRDNDMWCNGVILWQMLFGCKPWDDPHVSDARFRLIYNDGLAGLQRLLRVWNYSDQLPPYCGDFLTKIFCPQKCRLTVWEALVHPFITSGTFSEDFLERRVPVQIPAQPDHQLRRLAHLTRYGRVKTPESWLVLDQDRRQKIIDYLTRVTEDRVLNVLDRRVLLDVATAEDLAIVDARAIIHYLWASSVHPNRVDHEKHEKQGHFDNGRRSSDPSSIENDAVERKSDVDVSEKGNLYLDQHTSIFSSTLSVVTSPTWSMISSPGGHIDKSTGSELGFKESLPRRYPSGHALELKPVSPGPMVNDGEMFNCNASFGGRQRMKGRHQSTTNYHNTPELLPDRLCDGDEPWGGERRNSNIDCAQEAIREHDSNQAYHAPKLSKSSLQVTDFSFMALADV